MDFIIAPHLTLDYCEIKEIAGKSVRVETPEEIVLKKLFYRAETLKVRDIIDIAVVYRERKEHLFKDVSLIVPRLESIKRRWEKLRKNYSREASGLNILDSRLVDETSTLFDSFLWEVEKFSDSTVEKNRTSMQRKLRPKI